MEVGVTLAKCIFTVKQLAWKYEEKEKNIKKLCKRFQCILNMMCNLITVNDRNPNKM